MKRAAILVIAAAVMATGFIAAPVHATQPTLITTLHFAWDGDDFSPARLALYPDGTFLTNDGGAGRWTIDHPHKTFTLRFRSEGCRPIYRGTLIRGRAASGTMQCRTNSDHGRWFIDRLRVQHP